MKRVFSRRYSLGYAKNLRSLGGRALLTAFLGALLGALLVAGASPARAADPVYSLTVQKGERITEFRVEKQGKRHVLYWESDREPMGERTLRADDLSYLAEKLRAVPPGKESGCGRATLRLQAEEKPEAVACADGTLSATGRALTDLSNLLAGFL